MKGVFVFDLWTVFTAWPSGFKIGEVGFVVHRSGRAEVWCVGLSCGLSSLRVVRSLFFSLSLSFCLSPQQALCSYPRWHTEIAAGPCGLMSGWHTNTRAHTHTLSPLCAHSGVDEVLASFSSLVFRCTCGAWRCNLHLVLRCVVCQDVSCQTRLC